MSRLSPRFPVAAVSKYRHPVGRRDCVPTQMFLQAVGLPPRRMAYKLLHYGSG